MIFGIPCEIKMYLANEKVKKITKGHQSGDRVYQIGNKYILKISTKITNLEKEKIVNDYLYDKAVVSQSVAFVIKKNKAYYLKTMVQGENLITKKYLKNPLLLIDYLVKGLEILHNIDCFDCDIYNSESVGNVFVHGDYCLPNIVVNGDSIGFIDLQTAGKGDPWVDYAWCIWSLEYNLQTKEYTPLLLEKLNIEFDEEKYNKYIS